MDLSITGLRFDYAGRHLLDGLDLHVPAATCAVLLGPSGSGKTTLLRCIAGLTEPTAGTLALGGETLDGQRPDKRRIGFLFQEPALFPHLDLGQNVAFGLRYHGVPRADRAAVAETWLDRVGLGGRAAARIDELSGGERQRACLARTLAAEPRAVLLDEPLSALDTELRTRLGRDIKALLHEAGVPTLWVTHDEAEAERVGDAVYRLADGRAVPA